jgi:hypothetical protein
MPKIRHERHICTSDIGRVRQYLCLDERQREAAPVFPPIGHEPFNLSPDELAHEWEQE